MRRMQRLLFGMLLLAGLPACATTTSLRETDPNAGADFCAIAKPFRWNPQDTDESILQAKEWNAIGVKLCNWKGKKGTGNG